ncbi:MAG: flagellar hook-associated protein FlgK [Steroidobacteraceae bacterium]
MPDILRTGLSGLLAFQRALDTTSHNIANANTPGYSRQRVEFATRPAFPAGNGFIGAGVEVSTVRRLTSEYLVQQARTSGTDLSELDTLAARAEQLSNLLGDSSSGLSAAIQRFTNATRELAAQPTSEAARAAMLGEAASMIDRLKSFDRRIEDLDRSSGVTINADVNEINTLARSIATLNSKIVSSGAQAGQPPNDLLDERDRKLDELAKHIAISTVVQDGNSVSVFIANGQPLVLNTSVNEMVVTADNFDPSRSRLSMGATDVDITDFVEGGSLGGMLEFQQGMLDDVRTELGRVAFTITQSVNSVQQRGLDLDGNLGQSLFNISSARALSGSANAGTASVTVDRVDIGQLEASDFRLEFDGSSWSLRRWPDGTTTPLTGSGTAADPLLGAGLSMLVSGAPVAGDQFLVRPYDGVISQLGVGLSSGRQLAAASALRADSGPGNSGAATAGVPSVTDPANPALLTDVAIAFIDGTSYSINGSGSFAYTPGQPIQVNGWTLEINGAPIAGDSFTVRRNAGAVGDNSNAALMASSIDEPVLNGGRISAVGAIDSFVSRLASDTRRYQAAHDAQQLLFDEDMGARDAVSGVNLDEEAANMLRMQQAYQAAAQVIRVADTLFESLLAATRR